MSFWSILGCLLFLMVNVSAEATPDFMGPYTVDNMMPPEYPDDAKTNNIQGHVLVEILVNTDGAVEFLEIVESEPQGVFDSAVLEAVPKWRFTPVCGAKFSESFRVKMPFKFKLGEMPSYSSEQRLPIIKPDLPPHIAVKTDQGIHIKRSGLNKDCKQF